MHDQPLPPLSSDSMAADQQLVLPAPVMPDTIITPQSPPAAPSAPVFSPAPLPSAPVAAAPVQPAAAPSAAMPPQPVFQPAPPASVPATPAHPAVANGPMMADDGDLIEKEWVSQVQRIVSATAQDPYQQNQQIARLKSDYLQKRYGKVIKLDD